MCILIKEVIKFLASVDVEWIMAKANVKKQGDTNRRFRLVVTSIGTYSE